MKTQEKALELIEKMKPYVYCYMGSGMLTNDYDERTAIKCAKECAIIAVDQIVESLKTTTGHCTLKLIDRQEVEGDFKYWNQVKEAILTYSQEERKENKK